MDRERFSFGVQEFVSYCFSRKYRERDTFINVISVSSSVPFVFPFSPANRHKKCPFACGVSVLMTSRHIASYYRDCFDGPMAKSGEGRWSRCWAINGRTLSHIFWPPFFFQSRNKFTTVLSRWTWGFRDFVRNCVAVGGRKVKISKEMKKTQCRTTRSGWLIPLNAQGRISVGPDCPSIPVVLLTPKNSCVVVMCGHRSQIFTPFRVLLFRPQGR